MTYFISQENTKDIDIDMDNDNITEFYCPSCNTRIVLKDIKDSVRKLINGVINKIIPTFNKFKEENKEIKEENEKLKNTLKNIRLYLSEKVGAFRLYETTTLQEQIKQSEEKAKEEAYSDILNYIKRKD